jgi:Tfp pilus assembly protein FimV
MVTIPSWFIRYALPAGFLLLATVGVLALRPALHDAVPVRATRAAPSTPARVAPRPTRSARPRSTGYSVHSGDTLATIADRFGTTVDELLLLNPGIDPRALHVGQSLRVA